MAPPKKSGVARHIQITPYVRVKDVRERDGIETEGWWQSYDEDPRIDKALLWLKSQPKGTVQSSFWSLFVAAVNGELGVLAVPNSTENPGDTDEAVDALHDLLSVFAQ